MILVDFNSTAVANIAAHLSMNENEFNIDMIRHMILNSLLSYKKKFGSSYGEMVLFEDSKESWRKKRFPYYKASRKKAKDASEIDWKELYDVLSTVTEEVRLFMPYRLIKFGGAEADDGIAVAAKKYQEKHMIVSNDKDFQQLQWIKDLSQYSPLKGKNVICPKPNLYLREHIIRGDSIDSVPNVLSDFDSIVNPDKRQRPVRQVKLDEWIKYDTDDLSKKFPEFEGLEENIQRNKSMIDLNLIPEEIQEGISEQLDTVVRNNRQKMYKYFIANRLSAMLTEIQNF